VINNILLKNYSVFSTLLMGGSKSLILGRVKNYKQSNKIKPHIPNLAISTPIKICMAAFKKPLFHFFPP